MRRRWFRAKEYGWGWTPAVWQGWAVLGIYVLAIGAAAWIMAAAEPLGIVWFSGMLFGLMSVLALVVIAYRTGDAPGWRWGGKPGKRG